MFAYRMARELGFADADDWLKRTTGRAITEWMAFFEIEEEDEKPEQTKRDAMNRLESRGRRR